MRLAGPVEGVVGVELARHGRVGDLLHADGDVHVLSTPVASGRADPSAPGTACILMPHACRRCSKPASGPVGLYRRTVTSTAARRGARRGRRTGRHRGRASKPAASGSTCWWSTRPASRGTRPAATASPPARCGGSRRSASTCGRCRRTCRVTETVLVSPSGREVELPLPRRRRVRRCGDPGRARRRARRPRPRRSASTCATASASPTSSPTTTGSRSISTTARRCAAQWVVAADGHYSPVRRMLDADGPGGSPSELGTWHAFRQYFRGVDDRRLWVLFDPDLLPGYAWVFPLGGGRANVGLRRAARSAAAVYARASSSPRSGARLVDGSNVARHPRSRRRSRRHPPRLADPRVVRRHAAHARPGAVRRRRRERRRPDDRRGHRAGARHRRARGARDREPMPRRTASPMRYRRDVEPRARRRPAVRRARSSTSCASPLGARATIAVAATHTVDPPELRPLDVRGLPTRCGAHPESLAPRHVHGSGAYANG